ncbi:hypothetical protein ACFWP5_48870 [Streptomyces sp. NPDC058469]|uniref:terpene synthase family protein n=1 Tax=Streptomyces sp. NPDC058469 TaxID=3346514 RepID=UPI003657BA97
MSSSDDDVRLGIGEVPRLSLGFRRLQRDRQQQSVAIARCKSWCRTSGLVRSEGAFKWYESWKIEQLISEAYPFADGDGLTLCGKVVIFTALFDDQLDEFSEGHVQECAQKVQPFLNVLYGCPAPADSPTLLRAFAEIWRESCLGRSASWRARCLKGWEYYFSALVHESVNRAMGNHPRPLDIFFESRRGSGAMHPFLDVLEPGAGFELTPLAFNAPQIRVLRKIAIDLVDHINDVYSLPKELARGQTENLVMTLDWENEYGLAEARKVAVEMIETDARRFLEVRATIPKVCAALGLEATDEEDTLRYVDALEYWVGAFEPWQRLSPRYLNAMTERPPSEPWAAEVLL